MGGVVAIGFGALPILSLLGTVFSQAPATPDAQTSSGSGDPALQRKADGYEIVIKREPTNLSALQSLAQIRLQQGRTRDAIQLLKQAELFSRDPRVTLEIAGLYQQSGQTDLALSTYDSLMKTFPDAYPVLLGKAITLKSAGRLKEAQDLYTKALAKAPDNAKADVINIFTKTQVVTKTPVNPAK